ncbi:hypothetical protein SUGI_1157670 [Cryptomeria japonica]|nr:hypothetical protein SUGI_1157670 [Cryptomeria japonica]
MQLSLFYALHKFGSAVNSVPKPLSEESDKLDGSSAHLSRKHEEFKAAGEPRIESQGNAGRIEIDFSEEIEEDSRLWIEHTLIARIIGLNWPRRKIKDWVKDSWGSQTVIKFLPKGFFVVLFEDEAERERILNQENWFVVGHAMYIQLWTPNFNPIPLVVYSNPIWISLYNLPIEYWGEVYLEKIGRMLGTVLEVDFDDERDLCKIVRIRVAAVRKILEVVFLRTTNGIW